MGTSQILDACMRRSFKGLYTFGNPGKSNYPYDSLRLFRMTLCYARKRPCQKTSSNHPPSTHKTVNILQPIACILLGVLLGVIIGQLIAKKRRKLESQSEDYPRWHNIGDVFDEKIKLGDRIHVSFIEHLDGQKRLILRVYDKEANSRSMLYTATYYCVQPNSSRFKVSPGNFVVEPGAHESIRLAKFNWTDRGSVMV